VIYWRAVSFLQRFRASVLLIRQRETEIEELQRSALALQVAARDLAIAWRLSIEAPEVDLRDDLDALIRDLSDQVAQIQEHVV